MNSQEFIYLDDKISNMLSIDGKSGKIEYEKTWGFKDIMPESLNGRAYFSNVFSGFLSSFNTSQNDHFLIKHRISDVYIMDDGSVLLLLNCMDRWYGGNGWFYCPTLRVVKINSDGSISILINKLSIGDLTMNGDNMSNDNNYKFLLNEHDIYIIGFYPRQIKKSSTEKTIGVVYNFSISDGTYTKIKNIRFLSNSWANLYTDMLTEKYDSGYLVECNNYYIGAYYQLSVPPAVGFIKIQKDDLISADPLVLSDSNGVFTYSLFRTAFKLLPIYNYINNYNDVIIYYMELGENNYAYTRYTNKFDSYSENKTIVAYSSFYGDNYSSPIDTLADVKDPFGCINAYVCGIYSEKGAFKGPNYVDDYLISPATMFFNKKYKESQILESTGSIGYEHRTNGNKTYTGLTEYTSSSNFICPITLFDNNINKTYILTTSPSVLMPVQGSACDDLYNYSLKILELNNVYQTELQYSTIKKDILLDFPLTQLMYFKIIDRKDKIYLLYTINDLNHFYNRKYYLESDYSSRINTFYYDGGLLTAERGEFNIVEISKDYIKGGIIR